jgi:hypothetical protein
MTDFVDRIAQKISEEHMNIGMEYVRRSSKLEEGKGKKGQIKQAMKSSDKDDDEWGDDSEENSMRKRNKPKFKVKKKKAVWDDE